MSYEDICTICGDYCETIYGDTDTPIKKCSGCGNTVKVGYEDDGDEILY